MESLQEALAEMMRPLCATLQQLHIAEDSNQHLIFIGGPGTGTGLHRDPCDAWLKVFEIFCGMVRVDVGNPLSYVFTCVRRCNCVIDSMICGVQEMLPRQSCERSVASVLAVRADKLPRALRLVQKSFEGEFFSNGVKVLDYAAQKSVAAQLNSEDPGCAVHLSPVAGDLLFLPTEWPHMVCNVQVCLHVRSDIPIIST